MASMNTNRRGFLGRLAGVVAGLTAWTASRPGRANGEDSVISIPDKSHFLSIIRETVINDNSETVYRTRIVFISIDNRFVPGEKLIDAVAPVFPRYVRAKIDYCFSQSLVDISNRELGIIDFRSIYQVDIEIIDRPMTS